MDISPFIKELLFLHDCVIIPDFGGFVANSRPAMINHENNTFMPPAKDITFNKSLTHNDGLLISYISESREIGYVDAKRIVSEFVKDISRRLEKGKRVTFEEIGIFHYDKHKNLQFDPDTGTNFLLDSYGLSEFSFTPLEGYDLQKRLRKQFKDKEPVVISSRRKMLWRIAIAIPILVALVIVPLKTDLLKFKTDVTSLNPVNGTEVIDSNPGEQAIAEQKTIAGEKINVTGQEDETGDLVITETITEDESDVETVPAVIPEDQYYLIAGSFKIHENALRFQEELVDEGFPSIVMESENDLFRVTLNGYVTRDDAISAQREIRRNTARKEVWILSK